MTNKIEKLDRIKSFSREERIDGVALINLWNDVVGIKNKVNKLIDAIHEEQNIRQEEDQILIDYVNTKPCNLQSIDSFRKYGFSNVLDSINKAATIEDLDKIAIIPPNFQNKMKELVEENKSLKKRITMLEHSFSIDNNSTLWMMMGHRYFFETKDYFYTGRLVNITEDKFYFKDIDFLSKEEHERSCSNDCYMEKKNILSIKNITSDGK
jgi:hypothetical protein